MATFAVKVHEIKNPVQDHPMADRLSLIQIDGYTCISGKLEDGSHRYKVGDLVVYVPESAIVPEYLLRDGFWNEETNTGILAGPNGDRVKALRLRGIFSQGILFPAPRPAADDQGYSPMTNASGAVIGYASGGLNPDDVAISGVIHNDAGLPYFVRGGDDVSHILGITKYEPEIPAELLGQIVAIHGDTVSYDFESIQSIPDLFEPGERVIATEKLHGTHTQIGYVPGLNNDDMFFDGNLYVTSKGLGQQGFAFKNDPENKLNPYVRTLQELMAAGLGERIKALALELGQPVRVFGETFGLGIQKKGYHYGTKAPTFAVFDIKIGNEFVGYATRLEMTAQLQLPTVPVLYEGPFDLTALETVRDGKDTLSNTHLREGVVITARDGARHPFHGRKIGKWVSPDYLVKATGEEIQ